MTVSRALKGAPVAARAKPAARHESPASKALAAAAKPSLFAIPPVALLALGAAMDEGRKAYGLTEWRTAPVCVSTYVDALIRHLLAYRDGEDLDPTSPGAVPHLAKAMASAAILLDAAAQGTLIDDRGPKGRAADMIRRARR